MPSNFKLDKAGLAKLEKEVQKNAQKAINDSLRSSKNSSESSAASKLKRDCAKAGMDLSTTEATRIVRESRA